MLSFALQYRLSCSSSRSWDLTRDSPDGGRINAKPNMPLPLLLLPDALLLVLLSLASLPVLDLVTKMLLILIFGTSMAVRGGCVLLALRSVFPALELFLGSGLDRHHFSIAFGAAAALVGLTTEALNSRSAQYPSGNHTHSKPSLGGRGGSAGCWEL